MSINAQYMVGKVASGSDTYADQVTVMNGVHVSKCSFPQGFLNNEHIRSDRSCILDGVEIYEANFGDYRKLDCPFL